MTIAFAGAIGHAPGWVAWTERASQSQRDALATGAERLRQALEHARVDLLVMFTSEHWTNFFLDHVSAFCVGLGETHVGPVEPWMRMERTAIRGAPEIAQKIVAAAYDEGFEPSMSHELQLDHGTMVPLKFLTPQLNVPVVPIFFNTLVAPQPSPARCYALGEVIGRVARSSPQRIGLIATGGMSHDPGERGHGHIDSVFDQRFLEQMERGDGAALRSYSVADLGKAGAGAIELIAWVALAGALGHFSGEALAYEPVVPWATGMGVMQLRPV